MNTGNESDRQVAAREGAEKMAAKIAEAIKKITGEVPGREFDALDISHITRIKRDKVSHFLHNYSSPKSGLSFAIRYEALQAILQWHRVEGKRRPNGAVVYAYGTTSQVPEPPQPQPQPQPQPPKQPVPEMKIVKIEYPRKEIVIKKEKTPEEYMVDIKNEVVMLKSLVNELVDLHGRTLQVQQDMLDLFRALRDKK